VSLGYGLVLTAFGSFTYSNIQSGHYYPTYVCSHGEAYRRSSKTENRLGSVSLGWQHLFAGQHRLQLFGLFEAESSKRKGFYVTATNFSTDAYGYNNLSAAEHSRRAPAGTVLGGLATSGPGALRTVPLAV